MNPIACYDVVVSTGVPSLEATAVAFVDPATKVANIGLFGV